MRSDSIGFFWNDTPPPKPERAEKAKKQAPDPVWLRPDYLPGLEEARRFPVQILSLEEIIAAALAREEFTVDVECYPNYFLACFTNVKTGAVFYTEEIEGQVMLDSGFLRWALATFTTTGFNSNSYDIPICTLAVAGKNCRQLKEASDRIIIEELRGSDILREMKIPSIKANHIDLIEVAPLRASLKTYAGRLHAKKLQDLPFHPNTILTADQITIVRWYCVNDNRNTVLMRECLTEHIDLRYKLSAEYDVDLRSKSDAQIAEAVIGHELTKILGKRPQRPSIEIGTAYSYKIPHFIRFQSPLLNWALNVVYQARFVVDHTGSVAIPKEVEALRLEINGSIYRMGNGGLHSSEKTTAHHTDETYVLIDKDVTSYYPYIILNQGLIPQHLGPAFLRVYRSIVERRVAAKAAGNKVIADSLKIVVNGSFGKLGSKWSILYAPDLLIQTTMTGQLSLLMLIERLEMSGIHVVSANTDGIVIKCPRAGIELMNSIVAQWELETQFTTEETRYLALYSRDVNNYLAIKQKFDKDTKLWVEKPDGTKNKGAYSDPWSSTKNMAERLHKNPTGTICVEAVEQYLINKTPLDKTIRACRDITKFVTVRTVKGGGVKVWGRGAPPEHSSQEELIRMAGFYEIAKDAWIQEGQSQMSARYGSDAYKLALDMLSPLGPTDYLGKTVRWYYAKDIEGEIVYAGSGNKVPRSDGARPLMQLPEEFPDDVDVDWYVNESVEILKDIGAIV